MLTVIIKDTFFIKQIAQLINADPKEIIFTSGATESNNIAIKGVARFYKESNQKHIITTRIVFKKRMIFVNKNSIDLFILYFYQIII